jgi:putative ABC transport system permease protein
MTVALVRWLRQIALVTWYSLETIPQRLGAAASAAFGIAGVVAVLVGVLSIAQGIQRTMERSVSEDAAVVLRDGASSEMMSGLSREDTQIVGDTEGVLQGPDGPLASAELFVVIDLPKRSTGTDANVPLRGVGPHAGSVRDGFEIVQGRGLEWGRNEVIVGVGAAREFAGLDLGGSLDVGGESWNIVGVFAADGGLAESEVWTDAKVLQGAYRRGDSFQSVYARLSSPEAFEGFRDQLTSDPRVSVDVFRQDEYYAGQSALLTNLIRGLGVLITLMMAVGAVFGALNTMYSAVAARTREIATLRALGFKSGPVVVSVLFESFALAVVGGTAGGVVAYLAFDGFKAATINWQSFSQVAFAFDVTPGLVLLGIVSAAVIGFIGGLFPAIRAARMPIADALRAT